MRKKFWPPIWLFLIVRSEKSMRIKMLNILADKNKIKYNITDIFHTPYVHFHFPNEKVYDAGKNTCITSAWFVKCVSVWLCGCVWLCFDMHISVYYSWQVEAVVIHFIPHIFQIIANLQIGTFDVAVDFFSHPDVG